MPSFLKRGGNLLLVLSVSILFVFHAVYALSIPSSPPHQPGVVGTATLNNRPIIGIPTQPTTNSSFAQFGSEYINADYVKWVESAGGRVVPISYLSTPSELETIFKSINGIIFPGGGDILGHTQYQATLSYLFQQTLAANQAGDVFPLWGTCLGFEALHVLVANANIDVLTHFDAENISLPLQFTSDPQTSKTYSGMAPSLIHDLETQDLTENYHHWGVSTAAYTQFPELNQFFEVLSTSIDREGKVFVSSVEARASNLPIFATQYHPERSMFEWNPTEQINHSEAAILVGQFLANRFISYARHSTHHYPTFAQEQDAMIWNVNPLFVGKLADDDEQGYFWP